MQRPQTAVKMDIPPALSAKGLQVLPSTLRRLATAAYQPNADPKIVERVLDYATEAPKIKAVGLLPICFVHLDTDALPDAGALLRGEANALAAFHRAFFALETLTWIVPYDEGSSIDASPLAYFWPRAFVWYRLIVNDSAIWKLHPPTRYRSVAGFHADCISLGMWLFSGDNLAEDGSLGKPVIDTPDFIEQLFRLWSLAADIIDDDEDGTLLIDILSGYTWAERFRPTDLDHFVRVVDGAGGTVAELAKLLFKCLTAFYPRLDETAAGCTRCAYSPDSDSVATYCGDAMARIFGLIGDANIALRAPGWPQNQPYFKGALCNDLRDLGFIPILVDYALRRALSLDLSRSADESDNRPLGDLQNAITILYNLAGSNVGDKCGTVAEMVRSGLLEVLVRTHLSICRCEEADGVDLIVPPEDEVRFLIGDVLNCELARHSAVISLREILPLLKKTRVFSQVLASKYGDEWRYFVETAARDRIDVLEGLEGGKYAARTACDHLKCTAVGERSTFRRCSGCRTVYYCSKSCQRADWRRTGGHRAYCALRSNSPTLLANGQRHLASHNDRQFLRAILDHEQTTNWKDICAKQALCLLRFHTKYGHFPSAPLITAFNLTKTPAKISVHVSSETTGVAQCLSDAGDEWADFLARATEFREAFQLHMAKIYLEGIPRWVAIPLRSTAEAPFEMEKLMRAIAERAMQESNDVKLRERVVRAAAQKLSRLADYGELYNSRVFH
ncbi:hypothetical protein MKEN_00975800 [Mycena kentingensis (nom. inval.)]|nr:hypothetical protein MKEN_00975800 [Mycena kentingensis (nom. inval.)]